MLERVNPDGLLWEEVVDFIQARTDEINGIFQGDSFKYSFEFYFITNRIDINKSLSTIQFAIDDLSEKLTTELGACASR